MQELEAKIIELLEKSDFCQDITKYVQEQEIRRTLMPPNKSNELWYMARVPIKVTDEDKQLDEVSDEKLMNALFGSAKNTHHSLHFHFDEFKRGEGKYSPNDSGVLTLNKDKKVTRFNQCKLTVEYQSVPILETEDSELATKLFYYVVNSEHRYNQGQVSIKRKEFLELDL